MARILCFGDSNTWGFIPVPHGAPSSRFGRADRWPQVMAASLGAETELIEEGLNGRTTDADDPAMPHISGAGVNGAAYLSSALASHLPLDLVVIMLGTNDVKPHLARTAPRIALGAKRLLDIARTVDGGVGTAYPNPKIVLVCPPPLGTLSPQFAEQFAGGHAKNALMPALYEAVARAAGVGFLDAGQSIRTDGIDGVHFTAETQHALGHAVAAKVRGMLG